MLDRLLVSALVGSLLVLAGPAMAKEKVKAKKTAAGPHIYTQVECTGKKSMHWDDATQTCQKTK